MEGTENNYWTSLAKKAWDNYEKVLGLTLLITYAFGYSSLKFYYREFNIAIEHYIDISDMLFLAINSLLELLILFLGYQSFTFIGGLLIVAIISIFKKVDAKKFTKHLFRGAVYVNLILIVLFNVFPATVKDYIDNEFFYSLIIPSLIFNYCLLEVEKLEQPNEKKEAGLLIFFLVCAFVCFSMSAQQKAKDFKKGRYTKKIEFTANSRPYATSNNGLRYLGESNNYIFLYSSAEKKSLIFSKGGLSDYKVLQ